MRKNLRSAIAGAALVLLVATGCQATPPEIDPDQAEAFQSRVLAVTTAVADGGYAAALESLSALQGELDAAAADGSLTFARHQRITAAMDAVRADIEAAIAAQTPQPTPEPEPEPEPEESTAPVEEEEATPTPAPETEAEKKAREAEEKAAAEEARKAEEERQKAAEKAAEDLKKAEEEAKKRAEEEAKNTEVPVDGGEVDGED